MNIKQITDKLLFNWPIKLICLIVAIFLYIFHQTSLVERKNFVVPLQVIENGQVMCVDSVPASVTLSVRALSEDISDIHINDFTAVLDLSFISETGEYEIPIKISISDALKKFESFEIKIRPSSSIKVRVEEKIVKFIPLEASISGEPASGYFVESLSLEPSSVSVVGPASIVEKIEKLYTDKVLVSNAKTNFSTEVNYFPINKKIIVSDAGPYKATVVVSPMPMTKTYEKIAISALNLSQNLELISNIPEGTLVVDGTVPFLENYNLPKNAMQFDLSKISEPGEYELPVNVAISSNLSVKSFSPKTVAIKIVEKQLILPEESESETEKNIENPETAENL